MAAVSHGVAAALQVREDGKPAVTRRKMIGSAGDEEGGSMALSRVRDNAEMLVTTFGGEFVRAETWWEQGVVVEGQYITGQSLASAGLVGEKLASAPRKGKMCSLGSRFVVGMVRGSDLIMLRQVGTHWDQLGRAGCGRGAGVSGFAGDQVGMVSPMLLL